jgi:hypothetical protein
MWFLGVCGTILIVGAALAFSYGTEPFGRRDLVPGWLFGIFAAVMGIISAAMSCAAGAVADGSSPRPQPRPGQVSVHVWRQPR